ncbi:hypothetical protein PENTCL1PPCAC_11740, partial [Pristionchus entomophagus]
QLRMSDRRISCNMDVSKSAIRSALECSDQVFTNIQLLELIRAEHRKELYYEFLRDSQGMEMEEIMGFLPLQKVNVKDDKFVIECQKLFSEGITSPGVIFPIFGINKNGICVAERVDTVFTVNEENIDYWILVCAVAYNKDKVKETLIYSQHPEMPHQAMKWDERIDLRNEPPGWKRHFECIKDILYVGEIDGIGQCPRNVLPIALAKVHFNSKNSKAVENIYILGASPCRMERSNIILRMKELTCKKGQVVRSVFDKIHLNGVSLHSRYAISEEEWPLHLYFDSYATLPHVFNSWILKGKLDMEKLLNEGNVQMPANFFYDHSNKMCSRDHPHLVYLNYYQVHPPNEEKKMMIDRLIDLERRGIILFSCVPQVTRSGHSLYAGIPPGEIANRLGLPTIERGCFHLIHAMPVSKGTYEKVDRRTELKEIFVSAPFAAKRKEMNRNCRASPEVIDLVSDSEEERIHDERIEKIPSLINEEEKRSEKEELLKRLQTAGIARTDQSIKDHIRFPSLHHPPIHHPSSSSLPPSIPPNITLSSTFHHLEVSPLSPLHPLPPPPHSTLPLFSSQSTRFNESLMHSPSIESSHPDISYSSYQRQLKQPPSMARVIPSKRRKDQDDNYDPCEMDVSDDESESNPVENRRKHFENKMKFVEKDEARREGIRDYEGPTNPVESTERERRPSTLVDLIDEENSDIECLTISPDHSKSSLKDGFRTLKKSAAKIALNARNTPRGTPGSEYTNEKQDFVVWNYKNKGAENKSYSLLPPSASIIVIDNELFKQMKLNEMTGLIKKLNVLSTDDEKRILVVVHDDYDSNELNVINPSILFTMDHKGECSNDAKVECCDRVRKMGEKGRAELIYLTPNVTRDLSKNNSLTNLGFKILNVLGMENELESSQYEDEY